MCAEKILSVNSAMALCEAATHGKGKITLIIDKPNGLKFQLRNKELSL